MQYYMETVLPQVGADNLPAIVGNFKGPLAMNPILEIDSESHSICEVCKKADDCDMYGLSKRVEDGGGRITIDRCKSFKPNIEDGELD